MRARHLHCPGQATSPLPRGVHPGLYASHAAGRAAARTSAVAFRWGHSQDPLAAPSLPALPAAITLPPTHPSPGGAKRDRHGSNRARSRGGRSGQADSGRANRR